MFGIWLWTHAHDILQMEVIVSLSYRGCENIATESFLEAAAQHKILRSLTIH